MRRLEPLSLAELQARFQAAVVDGADDVLALIPPNSRTSSAVLFGVYRHAYVARLVEVVRNAYPILVQHMGEEAFDAMARGYVAAYPSRHANARWYGSDVPDFLAREAFAGTPELREIALLERQLDLAFDAVDAPVLDLAALAAFPPETWGGLTFRPHPSAQLLTFETNAFDLWAALKNGEAPPPSTPHPEPVPLLVWRRDGMPSVRRLAAEESMLWREAVRGKPFAGLAEMAAMYDDAETAAVRVAQYLHGWLTAGLISEAMT